LLFSNPSIEALIASLIAVGLGMTVHEFAHNYVGWRMGDPVPAREGRLTLNPFVHINWIGWLMFAIIGFGILGSAPISPYRMHPDNRRWRWLAAVAAGPFSNLLLAVFFAIIFRLVNGWELLFTGSFLGILLFYIVSFNILLFVFNLLPVFPLDGWQIVLSLLPPDMAAWWQRNQQTSYYIFFGLILLSLLRLPGIPNILGILIGQPVEFLRGLLLGA